MLTFPRVKHVDENGLFKQIGHIEGELKELIDAYFHEPTGRVAEEAGDLLHSVQTLLRILQEKHGVCLREIETHIREKNRIRGYYGAQ